ncbi:MAG: hypothetical protein WBL63_10145 [Candidatus Acidiferrum sp.]
MEKLFSGVHSQISQIFPETPPARELYLCACDFIDELASRIKTRSTYFGLLVAMDARGIDPKRIGEAAAKLLEKGLVYLCAWGADCERVHDIFDDEDLAKELGHGAATQGADDVSNDNFARR